MIILTEIKRTMRIDRELLSSFPRDEILRESIVVNPENIALLEPNGAISGIETTRMILNTGGSSVSKVIEGTVTEVRKKIIKSSRELLNG